jgi:UDP-N-acetylmuramoyl-tripeptide--D-alanyl-D-alanine ligase
VIELSAGRVAQEAGGELRSGDPAAPGPNRAVIDTRALRPGDLFVGLPGEREDGGAYAEQALAAGAWGVLVAPEHAPDHASGTVIAVPDPLDALGALARGWRRELGCRVVGITGSTGKTSTKDILAGLL